MRRFIACLLVCFSPSLYAQSTTDVQPQQCVWHAGDDVSWAAPGLNESNWTPLTKAVLPNAAHLWVRCHVPLDRLRGISRPSVSIYSASAYELFFQGAPVGGNGSLRSGHYSENKIRIYPIAIPGGSVPGIIALRITYRVKEGVALGQAPLYVEFGNEKELRADRSQQILNSIRPLLGYVILYGIVAVVGVIGLGLFWYDRSRRELLWLSLYCVFIAAMRVDVLTIAAQLDYSSQLDISLHVIGNLAMIFELLFFFSVARKRIPWPLWAACALSEGSNGLRILGSVLSPELSNRVVSFDPSMLHITRLGSIVLTVAPFVAFWPWNRIPTRLRPIAICCFLWSLSDFVYFVYQTVLLGRPDEYWQHVAVFFDARAILSGITVLVILALLFREQRRITEERAVLASEMQAARQIQRILAPSELPCAPRLAINVAFRPMREVGGDFYLCRVLADGRQRLLVGDVSGKGTAAAMTAALLLGAAELRDELMPGELLSHLSDVLRESRVGGFATCLCADVDVNGNLTFANAGHLAPYRNGDECELDSGLPLGVVAGADYAETALLPEPGDTLTFLSDGVVEARNSSGELFGFDRACAISDQSAEEIARAAQEFGQEDDITVLTLTFAPAEVLLA